MASLFDVSQPYLSEIATRFKGETAAQIRAHEAIARRHQRLRKDRIRKDGSLIPRLRVRSMERYFVDLYGEARLPDDDRGRRHLRLVADHLAQIDAAMIRTWAAEWMPDIEPADVEELIARVKSGRQWKADDLGRALGICDATRTRLKAWTIGAIDCSKAQRAARRKRANKLAKRAARAAAGAKPHVQSAERRRPWDVKGISRATYYRQKRTGETDSSAVPLSSVSAPNQSHDKDRSTPSDRRERPGASRNLSALGQTGRKEGATDEVSVSPAVPEQRHLALIGIVSSNTAAPAGFRASPIALKGAGRAQREPLTDASHDQGRLDPSNNDQLRGPRPTASHHPHLMR